MLKDLFANAPVDTEEMKRNLKRTAADLGLAFGEREKTYNSRLAQELGLWAESKGRGHEFHLAAFKAYFVDGKNIAQKPVLVDLAASVELPGDQAESVLLKRTFKAAVDADWHLSRQKMITAVPTFVMNQDKLVGAQPYEMLARLLEANGLTKRTGAGSKYKWANWQGKRLL